VARLPRAAHLQRIGRPGSLCRWVGAARLAGSHVIAARPERVCPPSGALTGGILTQQTVGLGRDPNPAISRRTQCRFRAAAPTRIGVTLDDGQSYYVSIGLR